MEPKPQEVPLARQPNSNLQALLAGLVLRCYSLICHMLVAYTCVNISFIQIEPGYFVNLLGDISYI